VTGGTHVPWSPTYEFLSRSWLPTLHGVGYRAEAVLERAGFFPRGGGVVSAVIDPVVAIESLSCTQRGELLDIRGVSAVAQLPVSIAERQRRRASTRLEELGVPVEIELCNVAADSPGTYLFVCAEYEDARCCFSALGARGKPAERVADEACDELIAHHAVPGAVEPHLADQLLLPLVLASGLSEFSTSRVSQHLVTHAELLGHFFEVAPLVMGKPGAPGSVRVMGAGVR
jgi:RNA 3'-terminal phosphate cyclase (ATP)